MNNLPKRIVIYSKDVENITGRRQRAANMLLQKIRKYYNKKKGDFITVPEFCAFLGMEEEMVREFLRD